MDDPFPSEAPALPLHRSSFNNTSSKLLPVVGTIPAMLIQATHPLLGAGVHKNAAL
jgi:hypothetical protein